MVTEITARELKARRDAGNAPLVLDVREAWELDLARIPDVVHIPMNEIPARYTELDANREIVVMCHLGGRSLQVAHFLDRQGFTSVANLQGGIHAWSRDVDPAVREY